MKWKCRDTVAVAAVAEADEDEIEKERKAASCPIDDWMLLFGVVVSARYGSTIWWPVNPSELISVWTVCKFTDAEW